MKRLIRSLGSSKTTSRIGFYTTLTVFLTMNSEISVENFLSLIDNELHPVNSNSKSVRNLFCVMIISVSCLISIISFQENGDIYMGRILAYGALIRSKILSKSIDVIQQQTIQDLINAGKQRSYLSFVSISFLIEFINQVDTESVKKLIWPIVEKEFGKPWAQQTLDSFYALLVIKNKCPLLVNNEFSKIHFDTNDIITKESMNDIVKVLLVSEYCNFNYVNYLFKKKLLNNALLIFRIYPESYHVIIQYLNCFVKI